MKRSLFCSVLAVAAVGTHFVSVAWAEEDAMAALKKAQQAQVDAPASRVNVTSSDVDNKKQNTIVLESVKPDLFHFRMEENGQTKMEMWFDGKETFMRHGPSGEIMQAPVNMSAMIKQAREQASINALLAMAKDIKFLGHENVNGVAASIYTFKTEVMGLTTTSKLWVSDADSRPLKAEGETHGELKIGAGPGSVTNKKSLTTFDYDASIKIVVPAK